MTEPASFAELRTRIREILPQVEALAGGQPDNRWVLSIARQLRYLDDRLGAARPTLDRAAEMNFGLLASHYVDDEDPALGGALHSISNAVRRLF